MTKNCNIDPRILGYIETVERDDPKACEEQHALVKHIRKCFETEDIYTDVEQLDKYMGLAKYFSFEKLFPWEEFLIALWDCTYWRESGRPRWKTVFGMVGRGAGKDGFIAFDGMCSISPYNKVSHYNVDVCANNEEQAKRPQLDFVEVLEAPKYEKKLNRHYYHTKEIIQGRINKGVMKGHTNNPKGRDGLRSGKVVFNEVHQYENYDNIKVFVTGMGKVGQPRVGFFTSNGDISDGPLDDYLARSRRILFEGEADKGFLPFICCLKNKEQVHDKANWSMANPSLPYLLELMAEIEEEYEEWKEHPEQNGDFLTKRFGIRATVKDLLVTDYENVIATNKPLPDLTGWSCVCGIDYAELSDWAAVNLHFKCGEERFDINHAWLCLKSKTLHRVKVPWQDWVNKGHITAVDDVGIHPDLLANWIWEQMKQYNIKMIALDNHRHALVAESLRKIGFDANERKNIKLVKPLDIMKVEPVIQECFNRQYFSWGDVPHLRWAVRNTKRAKSGVKAKTGVDTGNYIYSKIEAKSRKTDPFMALVAAMTVESVLGNGAPVAAPPVGAFTF